MNKSRAKLDRKMGKSKLPAAIFVVSPFFSMGCGAENSIITHHYPSLPEPKISVSHCYETTY